MVQFIQKNSFEATQIEDEWIILDTDQYTVTRVNDLGGFCWSKLCEAQTVDSLQTAIDQEYGAECEKDSVVKFLTDLEKCGLIRHAI
ncbi:PqqD family protein [Bacillus sp. ISL-35]|uniref:PqqD family protein n=1 Tax=Bacillus sp. ISL-35 TaxID=2819122 RepID=UPI001BE8B6CD|nr:PqqD family protein [Bacillus sp. ISL-35]MBT2679809.1 PqqD family protein [Bacillus sp. ISL-35]MBT2704843.1 PqqD family protein [Chryseobacterium sp. ISL-80]